MDDEESDTSSSDDDDESTMFDRASPDMDSLSDDADTMDCDCRDAPAPRAQRPQSRSPRRRDSSFGSHYRKKSQGPIAERRERYQRRYCDFDVTPAKNYSNAKRTRGIAAGSLDSLSRAEMYHIQRINDQEVRARLFECEARIERWERALEHQVQIMQKLEAFQQLKPRRSPYELSSMRH